MAGSNVCERSDCLDWTGYKALIPHSGRISWQASSTNRRNQELTHFKYNSWIRWLEAIRNVSYYHYTFSSFGEFWQIYSAYYIQTIYIGQTYTDKMSNKNAALYLAFYSDLEVFRGIITYYVLTWFLAFNSLLTVFF